ncbi:hypothetical protein JB92DRAFT_2838628 [Gautieria morchelliformis]|nr:hypothetical protein JB92DRAFT_2838628 [Gautieria morchelliformis]
MVSSRPRKKIPVIPRSLIITNGVMPLALTCHARKRKKAQIHNDANAELIIKPLPKRDPAICQPPRLPSGPPWSSESSNTPPSCKINHQLQKYSFVTNLEMSKTVQQDTPAQCFPSTARHLDVPISSDMGPELDHVNAYSTPAISTSSSVPPPESPALQSLLPSAKTKLTSVGNQSTTHPQANTADATTSNTTCIKIKKEKMAVVARKGPNKLYYPEKGNSVKNLFAIDFCQDNPKST